ncbi:hypothetical protein KSP40_PGU010828 [Platanthera guangdongensis]|uniref:Pentatricopeptide repeat-containing protein n=1 Tax=Platanthera guangdongensis TaxID=2320717 RepID=A0ABR2LHK6_9ASPA
MARETLEFFAATLSSTKPPNPAACNLQFLRLFGPGAGVLALKLLPIFVSHGIRPHLPSLNSAVAFLCRLNQPHAAERLAASIPALGCTPDLVTFNSLIDGHCRSGDLRRASLSVTRLRCFGPLPDAITYNTMIVSLFKHQMPEFALAYLCLMWKSQLPDAVTYGILVDMFCKQGNPDSALAAMNDMRFSRKFSKSGYFHLFDRRALQEWSP